MERHFICFKRMYVEYIALWGAFSPVARTQVSRRQTSYSSAAPNAHGSARSSSRAGRLVVRARYYGVSQKCNPHLSSHDEKQNQGFSVGVLAPTRSSFLRRWTGRRGRRGRGRGRKKTRLLNSIGPFFTPFTNISILILVRRWRQPPS